MRARAFERVEEQRDGPVAEGDLDPVRAGELAQLRVRRDVPQRGGDGLAEEQGVDADDAFELAPGPLRELLRLRDDGGAGAVQLEDQEEPLPDGADVDGDQRGAQRGEVRTAQMLLQRAVELAVAGGELSSPLFS